MNGRPMNALEYYAQLAAQQQQVPAGNPVADYYQGRADNLGTLAKTSAAGTGIVGGMGLSELFDMSPWALPLLLGAGGVAAYGGNVVQDQQARQGTADMWFNRFGSGDPNQGLPGTPSGPAYRRR